jgi:hypothetical protein
VNTDDLEKARLIRAAELASQRGLTLEQARALVAAETRGAAPPLAPARPLRASPPQPLPTTSRGMAARIAAENDIPLEQAQLIVDRIQRGGR